MKHYLLPLHTLNLLLVALLGIWSANFYLTLWKLLLLLLFAMVIEWGWYRLKHQSLPFFPYSALITALGVGFMLVSTHYWLYGVVIFLGLFQKHLLPLAGFPPFNPSNFALVSGLLLFYHDTHLVFGQLGDEAWFALWVLVCGVVILWGVKRFWIPLAFVVGYWLFQYVAIVGIENMVYVEDITRRFYGVSFLLFILFMLTDPQTTPSSFSLQILFGVFVALGATLLDYLYGFRLQHIFLSLFMNTPLILLFEKREKRGYEVLHLMVMILLTLSAIIYLENQPPYYFAMDG